MQDPAKGTVPAPDRRKKARYAISPSFPPKVVLALPYEDGDAWKDWSATLVDLSATGAHVEVSMAAVAYPESRCRLKLSLGPFKLEIPGTIAHFVCSARLAVGGVQFSFPNQGVEKAYHRVLEPAIIGATLAPVEASQEKSVRFKEEYAGKLSARLTIWRESRGSPVCGFDFRMNRYGVEADREPVGNASARLALKFKLGAAEETTGSGSQPPLTGTQIQEARWLYRLAASNLSPAVAADVRKLLLSLV